MANFENKVNVHENAPVANWISQINAGGTVYDIATHHGIKFVEGSEETTWNGLSDLTVVIPTIEDIVQTPIEFAGTVTADETISWIEPHGKDGKAEVGNLVFVTVDCTFAGKACEAGDMAIYDGSKWNIVSGENQVQLKGTTDAENKITVAVGAAADVLSVEGKTLALTLDYDDINGHVSKRNGEETDIVFKAMTVGSVDIKLNKADDVPTTIGEVKTITYGTALANGTVNLTGATGLVNGITWGKFSQGTKTTSEKNSAQNLTVTGGGLDLSSKLSSGDFVDSVKLSDAVKFVNANTDEAGSIKMLTTLTSSAGAQFFNGIHVTLEKENADFTTAGYIAPMDGVTATYVKGLEGNLTPVTSITDGNFELIDGSELATGFGTESTTGEVVSSVSVSAKNDTSVLKTAKVENHVLSFDPVNVASDVTTTCSYKSLTKKGFKYTAPKATNTAFATSGFKEVAGVSYTFGRGNETVYSAETKNWKLSTPGVDVTYGTYTFNDDTLKAAVPAQTFVTSVTAGQLPSLSESTFSTTSVTGTVETALTTSSIDFNALKSNSINMPGKYSLETVASGGDITVGKNGALAAYSATIDLSGYLKDVEIVKTKVSA